VLHLSGIEWALREVMVEAAGPIAQKGPCTGSTTGSTWRTRIPRRPSSINIIYKEEFGGRRPDIRYVDCEGVPPVKERGPNIRFRPDSGETEALSSSSRSGRTPAIGAATSWSATQTACAWNGGGAVSETQSGPAGGW